MVSGGPRGWLPAVLGATGCLREIGTRNEENNCNAEVIVGGRRIGLSMGAKGAEGGRIT